MTRALTRAPATAGIAYVAAWVTGLSVWMSNLDVEADEPGRQDPSAADQCGPGDGHERQHDHLDAVEPIDQLEQRFRPGGVGARHDRAGEVLAERALNE
jgi:hypothetical protein